MEFQWGYLYSFSRFTRRGYGTCGAPLPRQAPGRELRPSQVQSIEREPPWPVRILVVVMI